TGAPAITSARRLKRLSVKESALSMSRVRITLASSPSGDTRPGTRSSRARGHETSAEHEPAALLCQTGSRLVEQSLFRIRPGTDVLPGERIQGPRSQRQG